MEKPRVNLGKSSSDSYQSLVKLDRVAGELVSAAGIAQGFSHLLRLRASQLNHCAYCVRMHARDALAQGETSDRLAVLSAWRESQYFTAKERAALALIEAVTLVADDQIPDALYADAAAALSEQEIAAVQWLGVVINAWNRIAIASRYPVQPE